MIIFLSFYRTGLIALGCSSYFSVYDYTDHWAGFNYFMDLDFGFYYPIEYTEANTMYNSDTEWVELSTHVHFPIKAIEDQSMSISTTINKQENSVIVTCRSTNKYASQLTIFNENAVESKSLRRIRITP